MPRVTVTVSGPTGSGKSRIALEIEVALKAAGIKAEWSDIDGRRQAEAEAHAEATGGWQPDIPYVLLQEINLPISVAEGRRQMLVPLALTSAWDDLPLPEDAEIRAAHPVTSGRDDLYMEGMRLVGARRSKGGLVELVTWLLLKAEAAKNGR